jgi:hypothetical protein
LVSKLKEDWCFNSNDHSAFSSGSYSDNKCDANVYSKNLFEDDLQTTLSIGLKTNGGMKARPATFHIGFDNGGATVSPTTYLDQTITLNTMDRKVVKSCKKYYSSPGGTSVVGPHGNNGRGVTISPGESRPRTCKSTGGYTGYRLWQGEDRGLDLPSEYTISLWVKNPNSGPIILLATTKSRSTFSLFDHLFACGRYDFCHQFIRSEKSGQQYKLGTVKYTDLFGDGKEWIRITLVAKNEKTLVYKFGELLGDLPVAVSGYLFYVGSGRKEHIFGTLAEISYW